MTNVIQMRPDRPMFQAIDESDVRKELRAYCDGMKQGLEQRPTDGELEMLISLSVSVNSLLRSLRRTRQANAIKAMVKQIVDDVEALCPTDKP